MLIKNLLTLLIVMYSGLSNASTCQWIFSPQRPSTTKGVFESSKGERLWVNFKKVKNAKETIVILHGLGDSSFKHHKASKYWQQRGKNVLLLDFIGHGKSLRGNTSIIHYQRNVEVVIELIQFMGLKNIHLVGHSYGGAIALLAAQTLQAQKISLLSPYVKRLDSYFGENRYADHILDLFYSIHLRQIYREYIKNDYPSERLSSREIEQRTDEALAAMRGIRDLDLLNLPFDLSRNTKIKIIHGEKDNLIRINDLLALEARLLEQGMLVEFIRIKEFDHHYPKKQVNKTIKLIE